LIHRDISYNNILIFNPEDRKPQECRSGLLIDFEYATRQSRSRALAPGSRTVRIFFPVISYFHLSISVLQGTAPFMAIELLVKKSMIRHATYHDLESLFFVLIYICTNLSGPGNIRTREELQVHSSIPLSVWYKASSSLREVGILKSGALCDIETNILKSFAPYFEDFKPYITKLFKTIYSHPGTPKPVTHDEVIKIFTEMLDILPHETTSIPVYEPLSASSPSRFQKHSLGIHDRSLSGVQKKQKYLSRDAKVSEPSNSNWALIFGNSAASGRESTQGTSRSHSSRSRWSGRSGQSVSQPR
jgi:serine/threonine protein kinase